MREDFVCITQASVFPLFTSNTHKTTHQILEIILKCLYKKAAVFPLGLFESKLELRWSRLPLILPVWLYTYLLWFQSAVGLNYSWKTVCGLVERCENH